MKRFMLWAAAILAIFSTPAHAAENSRENNAMPENPKILVAYFSRSGNTRAIAEMIQTRTGADIFEIKPAAPYPEDYRQTADQAKAEQNADARPALSGAVADMSAYDIVFIGYPNWWSSMPMPVFTFLESYDFSQKTVIPFVTHGGGGAGHSLGDLKRLVPGADTADAFVISGGRASSAQSDIGAWIEKTGVIHGK